MYEFNPLQLPQANNNNGFRFFDHPGGNNSAMPGNPGGGGYQPNWLDNAVGWTDTQGQHAGWAGAAMNTFSGLANTYLGIKQYGLAKDSLNENKRQFNLNFGNQAKLTNARLEDRQRARVASNPTAYRSVGDYMQQNGVGQ